MSPISSRNSVPPSACSKRPMWRLLAPVNAPASCPKSSLSSSSDGIAAVLSATKGLRARGDSRCSARATSSLPVPVSPVTSTPSGACAKRPMARNSACIAGVSPTSPSVAAICAAGTASAAPVATPRRARTGASACSASATAASRSNGLERNSCAPPRKAPAVLAISVYALITITGSCGCRALSASNSTRPSSPGIRTSVNSRSGAGRSPMASSTARAESNAVTA